MTEAEDNSRTTGTLPINSTSAIMTRIIAAGSLAMVYLHLCVGAQQTEFARKLGATKFHFGLLGAIPPAMLVLQFAAGLLVNRMRHRKPLWLGLLLVRRASTVLIGLIPWVIPGGTGDLRIWAMVGLLIVGNGLGTFSQPMFYSWMGDLLPHKSLNEFWGRRRKWLCLSQALTMVVATLFFWVFQDSDIYLTYLIAVIIGSIAGVCDILLFIRIPEPEHKRDPNPGITRLIAPFKSRMFRRLMLYFCALNFATMLSAPFMKVFMLEEIGLALHLVVLVFTFHALGGMLFARRLGSMLDRFGHRPVVMLCGSLKCIITLTFMLVRPGWSLLALFIVLPFDNMLNTGLLTAKDGFTMKLSPPKERAMYAAAVLATSGAAAAAGSLCGGILLEKMPDIVLTVKGVTFSNFRVIFAASAVLRLISFAFAIGIHEPGSGRARDVIRAMTQRSSS